LSQADGLRLPSFVVDSGLSSVDGPGVSVANTQLVGVGRRSSQVDGLMVPAYGTGGAGTGSSQVDGLRLPSFVVDSGLSSVDGPRVSAANTPLMGVGRGSSQVDGLMVSTFGTGGSGSWLSQADGHQLSSFVIDSGLSSVNGPKVSERIGGNVSRESFESQKVTR
jgi:hypothetical protein